MFVYNAHLFKLCRGGKGRMAKNLSDDNELTMAAGCHSGSVMVRSYPGNDLIIL